MRAAEAIDDLGETAKITDIAERVTILEVTIKDLENLKTYEHNQGQTLRNLVDWIDYLKRDNERHKHIISKFLILFAASQGNKELLKTFSETIEREYGVRLTNDLEFVRIKRHEK